MKKLCGVYVWSCLLLSLTAHAEETTFVTFVSWVGLQGGADYATAAPLPAGRTLRLNHDQFNDRYDHFWIDLKGGQTVTFSLAAGTRGIRIQPDGTFIETDDPYTGLQIRSAQGDLLGEIEIAGKRNAQKSIEVDAASPQRLYVLVGSAREGMHKDQFVFRADIKDNFDGGSDRDAGSSPAAAVPLGMLGAARGNYGNFLTQTDVADYFRFKVSPGEKVVLQIVPSNPRTRLLTSLYNEVFVEIDRGHSLRPGGAIRIEAVATSPTLYLRVYRDVGDEPTEYAIIFPENLPPLVKAAVQPEPDYFPKFLKP